MADHYGRSVDLLDQVDEHRAALREEYASRPHRKDRIADLHAAIGVDLKLAAIHAQLATAQALQDQANWSEAFGRSS